MAMTSKQRFLAALDGKLPDRLPVTTHHVMPYFLDKYMDGISHQEFFDYFGFDPILWTVPHKCDESKGEYYDPSQGEISFLESRRVATDNWRIELEEVDDPRYQSYRFNIITPKGTLTTLLQANEQTAWVSEHLVKEKKDIELIGEFVTTPKCDVEAVNKAADEFGQRGLVRGHICIFDIYGQPGCWQDACCLFGTEKMIMATFDDPKWVHEFLTILKNRKKGFIESTKGAKYDILEHGGGDASSSVISPKLLREFVIPYDIELIEAAHAAGQRISYHTCGGMMPILEDIASMKPDAMETFTPPGMGGDANLAEAKKRIGDKVCMIGGFDQFHFFNDCSSKDTAAEVRKCFKEAGKNGGYILCPSDHFFDAQVDLVKAFADEAHKCTYKQ